MSTPKTIIEIVEQYLIDNGYDGLYEPDAEWACEIGDLKPCGECLCECIPGYKHPGDGEFDYYIKPHKP